MLHRAASLPKLLVTVLLCTGLASTVCAQFRGGQGDGHHESSASATASLPLTILSLSAKTGHEARVDLTWVTEDESDTETISIERSGNGITFTPIGSLPAAGDARGRRLTYTFTDAVPLPGVSYYRLRVVDFDGSLTLSAVVSVSRDATPAPSFSIYPNPTNGLPPTLSVPDSGAKGKATVTVYDLHGKKLHHLDVPRTGGPAPLPRLPVGTYRVGVTAAGTLQAVKTLLVTHAP